ncbi:hypothetical protein D8I24_4110 (plasmid) [Cupriavidus necator H850]|uniref:hypothetical protein n=1 Tax=Cupriavidus necator TaxID=106590 RepID=UPI00129E8A63|nr:hypothetical protein [Cupriavidus necator]KAI3600929.1 hypothetical protein D8I24_4110 [Cupriavidus necator H850]
MQSKISGHTLNVFADLVRRWHLAEIEEKCVDRFGPFGSHKLIKESMPVLFPEVPVPEVAGPSVSADDDALMILRNAERAGKVTECQSSAAPRILPRLA